MVSGASNRLHELTAPFRIPSNTDRHTFGQVLRSGELGTWMTDPAGVVPSRPSVALPPLASPVDELVARPSLRPGTVDVLAPEGLGPV